MSAPEAYGLSMDTWIFLTEHAHALRELARHEQRAGRFTIGLSRAIDVLDLENP